MGSVRMRIFEKNSFEESLVESLYTKPIVISNIVEMDFIDLEYNPVKREERTSTFSTNASFNKKPQICTSINKSILELKRSSLNQDYGYQPPAIVVEKPRTPSPRKFLNEKRIVNKSRLEPEPIKTFTKECSERKTQKEYLNEIAQKTKDITKVVLESTEEDVDNSKEISSEEIEELLIDKQISYCNDKVKCIVDKTVMNNEFVSCYQNEQLNEFVGQSKPSSRGNSFTIKSKRAHPLPNWNKRTEILLNTELKMSESGAALLKPTEETKDIEVHTEQVEMLEAEFIPNINEFNPRERTSLRTPLEQEKYTFEHSKRVISSPLSPTIGSPELSPLKKHEKIKKDMKKVSLKEKMEKVLLRCLSSESSPRRLESVVTSSISLRIKYPDFETAPKVVKKTFQIPTLQVDLTPALDLIETDDEVVFENNDLKEKYSKKKEKSQNISMVMASYGDCFYSVY
ncbi:hypothetical protein EIN_381520 [Entamoeba invadens IP1]|uniref:Uncharacterized protein n=1 Tax=Entamoeba invadens IP1 TaxID=370355 RepID=A0A0A1UB11_ENTIV|nr:hypothetical protein EIN_381520 [Entamoeba invadens IP1]ELP92185.1 hypothetical protein EIN_381520 [Entamoeba invadens IP1]|eukprot:XP_004258956.1 hypothetical protein EIN_381520 [Entamoeba invadens IP1]